MCEYRKVAYPKACKYRFVGYHIDDYPEEWILEDGHDDDECDWQCARQDMYEDVLELAREVGCVGIWNGPGRPRYYLHRSTRHDGMQLTCWDERGPVGHADVDTAERLAFEVNWNEFTVYEEAA